VEPGSLAQQQSSRRHLGGKRLSAILTEAYYYLSQALQVINGINTFKYAETATLPNPHLDTIHDHTTILHV